MTETPEVIEPMEDFAIGSEDVQVYNSMNYYGEVITDTKVEKLTDEEVADKYQHMTPVQR